MTLPTPQKQQSNFEEELSKVILRTVEAQKLYKKIYPLIKDLKDVSIKFSLPKIFINSTRNYFHEAHDLTDQIFDKIRNKIVITEIEYVAMEENEICYVRGLTGDLTIIVTCNYGN